ncbi:hypothetical protein FWC63_01335 [Candidatus Saccharibacteria bacterium]|nr:hypothetical protein [Candidatus Saccharibacteria bacterium]
MRKENDRKSHAPKGRKPPLLTRAKKTMQRTLREWGRWLSPLSTAIVNIARWLIQRLWSELLQPKTNESANKKMPSVSIIDISEYETVYDEGTGERRTQKKQPAPEKAWRKWAAFTASSLSKVLLFAILFVVGIPLSLGAAMLITVAFAAFSYLRSLLWRRSYSAAMLTATLFGVVIVHGWFLSPTSTPPSLEALNESTFSVMAGELPGQAETPELLPYSGHTVAARPQLVLANDYSTVEEPTEEAVAAEPRLVVPGDIVIRSATLNAAQRHNLETTVQWWLDAGYDLAWAAAMGQTNYVEGSLNPNPTGNPGFWGWFQIKMFEADGSGNMTQIYRAFHMNYVDRATIRVQNQFIRDMLEANPTNGINWARALSESWGATDANGRQLRNLGGLRADMLAATADNDPLATTDAGAMARLFNERFLVGGFMERRIAVADEIYTQLRAANPDIR